MIRRLSSIPLQAPDGEPVVIDWRRHEMTVIVILHDAHCYACRKTSHRFSSARPHFVEEGCALLLVWRGTKIPDGCEGFLDGNGKARRKWLLDDSIGVLIVDRQGAILREWRGTGKGFPSPEEVLAEVRHYLSQCPE